jgi:choline dehydrogenase-like flavoprotein
LRERYDLPDGETNLKLERTIGFVLAQHGRMPDYLRTPFVLATLFFNYAALLTAGKPFHNLSSEQQWKHIERARNLGPFRDLMRFYEGLSVFAYGDEMERQSGEKPQAAATPPTRKSPAQRRYEIAVIGSGPGGAITACLLAEAGRDVLLLEAGGDIPLGEKTEFSRDEMERRYRNGGITAAFGRTKISYVEGRCVGGGSEINAGLYHRTPNDILERWRREFDLKSASPAEMLPHFEACERDVSVSLLPGPQPETSLKMQLGAELLGWKSFEVPRWYKYGADGSAQKQSMSRTYIPRALQAGCALKSGTSALRLRRNGNGWAIDCETSVGERETISCDTVFVCAGAIQTAALLLRSGIGTNIGKSFRVHPTVKVIAEFPEAINTRDFGITVHQVKEFSPRLGFGVSVSRAPYVSLAMLDHPGNKKTDNRWQQMGIYYAMITGGNGHIRTLPYYRDALVSYALDEADMRNLADGATKLSELLFAAGAETLYPSVAGSTPFKNMDDVRNFPGSLPADRSNLMSVHLFSSCPMGEDRTKCAANSFGKVHGAENLYINDASLLCTAPGVNPQGSIMAFARRNALHFLNGGKS